MAAETIGRRPATGDAVREFVRTHREFIAAGVFFLCMLAVFAIANPSVWLSGSIYSAVATTLPQLIILGVALVFVVTLGEIDLAFPSVITLASLIFASSTQAGVDPFAAAILALLVGTGAGIVNGLLVAYLGLTSFVVTLGMNFFWTGLINVLRDGKGIPLQSLTNSAAARVLTGTVGSVPAQLFWGVGFALIAGLLFSKHKFGAYCRFVGDNQNAAAQMGVPVRRIKTASFGFVGFAAGFVGVIVTLVNVNFYPDIGANQLLPALAAVFVGGTPMLGGVGTIAGAAIGAGTISFISVGIITTGLAGFYTDLVYGIVIVVSLGFHRVVQRSSKRGARMSGSRVPAGALVSRLLWNRRP